MKKYKLINRKTKEETICTKVHVDGFDYYVSDEVVKDVRPYYGKWQLEGGQILNTFPTYLTDLSDCKLVIATTNPNIDIPKVIEDEFMRVALYREGYNKHKETNPFSDEDMIEFVEWLGINEYRYNKKFLMYQKHFINETLFYTSKELLKLCKEQKVETIYYE